MLIRSIARKLRDVARVLLPLLRPAEPPASSRFAYQQHYLRHSFVPGESVLDIGSGGDPFRYATVLADRYLEPRRHRSESFRAEGRPAVICDIHQLPFADQQFDYVVCSHVLEHVDDPVKACRELQRVGKAGFIETPTLMKDALFAWADGMHKWHVSSIANRLVFFEYSPRQLAGVQSRAWERIIFSSVYHPLQSVFNKNQDLFNVMLEWRGHFDVLVLRLDGSVESLSTAQPQGAAP